MTNPAHRMQGIVAIVDDDAQISHALGAWLDMHDLRALHLNSAEALLQTLQRCDDGATIFTAAPIVGAGKTAISAYFPHSWHPVFSTNKVSE